MPTPPAPLFFPEALHSPGHWNDLGKTHGLTRKDFEWFSHLELASQTLRSQQTPPMTAEKILLSTGDLKSVPLAGSFVLGLTPDDKGEILYTPYAGIKKFHSRSALTEQLQRQLNNATEDDDLLALMSLSARKTLAASTSIQMTFEAIQGDVFDDQRTVIANHQRMNEQALLNELIQLPTLTSLLDTVLDELLKPSFPGLDQGRTRLNFYSAPDGVGEQNTAPTRHWINSMSLSEAVLSYYRHQRWPTGQFLEFTHPQKKPASADRQHWETAIKTASSKLISLLSRKLKDYWDSAGTDGASRRDFFSRAIGEKARAEFLIKRETNIISPEQSQALHQLIQPTTDTSPTLSRETVRL